MRVKIGRQFPKRDLRVSFDKSLGIVGYGVDCFTEPKENDES